MTRSLFVVLFACLLSAPLGDAHAEEGEAPAEPSTGESSEGATSDEAAGDEESTIATFGHSYPVRFARRPLVLDEGMVRADGRLTVGGVFGSGTFSALDLGGAVSPIENLEVGLSTEVTGSIPAPGGISLISIIFSPPKASYGDIPVYARYQVVDTDSAQLAVDFVLVLPTNTDFSMTAALPLRIIELFDFVTLDSRLGVRYLNGDSYPGFGAKNTAQFFLDGGAVINITDNGFFEIGGGVAVVNVGGTSGAKNVVEIPAYVGGGYTYEGKVLADIFAQFGWDPLMTAGGPTGVDTFNVKETWYLTLGATVHTKELFGKNKQ
jgi:hypothetical protein